MNYLKTPEPDFFYQLEQVMRFVITYIVPLLCAGLVFLIMKYAFSQSVNREKRAKDAKAAMVVIIMLLSAVGFTKFIAPALADHGYYLVGMMIGILLTIIIIGCSFRIVFTKK